MSVQQLFEQITELLGKPGSSHIHFLNQLVQILGEKPKIQELGENGRWHNFEQSGFRLSFDNETDMFLVAHIRIDTASIRAGSRKQYRGNLPFEIKFDDSEEEVERKSPGGIMVVKDYRSYVQRDLRPLIVIFHFYMSNVPTPIIGLPCMGVVTAHYEDPLNPRNAAKAFYRAMYSLDD